MCLRGGQRGRLNTPRPFSVPRRPSKGATAIWLRCIIIIGAYPSAAPRSGWRCITSIVAPQMGRCPPRGFSGVDFLTSLKPCYRTPTSPVEFASIEVGCGAIRRHTGCRIVLSPLCYRPKGEMSHFMIKRNATARLDLSVAGNRTLGKLGPDAIRIKNAGDASLVVVAAKNALVRPTVGGFIGSMVAPTPS